MSEYVRERARACVCVLEDEIDVSPVSAPSHESLAVIDTFCGCGGGLMFG